MLWNNYFNYRNIKKIIEYFNGLYSFFLINHNFNSFNKRNILVVKKYCLLLSQNYKQQQQKKYFYQFIKIIKIFLYFCVKVKSCIRAFMKVKVRTHTNCFNNKYFSTCDFLLFFYIANGKGFLLWEQLQ